MNLGVVKVQAKSPDFAAYAYQSYYEVTAGQAITDPTFVNSTDNFSGSITLSLTSSSGLVKSYAFAVNPVSLMPNSTIESDLTITTDSSAQPNFYTLTIHASNSTSTHTFQISISLLSSVSIFPSIILLPTLVLLITTPIKIVRRKKPR